jgi:uncharacterized protein (UPF0332 family)
VSPRSEEFIEAARDRLAAARAAQEAGFPATALSTAYYATLYAARAALSEEERNAKTHRGTWAAFSEVFVAPGRFDRGLAAQARRIQTDREAVDYDARDVTAAEAEAALEHADRFIAEIERVLIP